ncbi:MAG: hypothetical protein QOD50_459 [Actinomycetota bacterium]|nr:hypothetical protein [Actinomycetota bacterium]
MKTDEPVFTIVIATFDRGPLIAATLESVAAQTLSDIEVLVVSDGPLAPGLAETVKGFGERFQLHQLETRSRSQSGPNNYGWAAARGRYIAYLGHDDIWHPEHLARLFEAFASHPEASFAVAGCVFFGPSGASESHTWVTGMFDSSETNVPREHFFPPSSFAHRRDLPPEIPRWQNAELSREPVDVRFLKGAAGAELRFAATGVVTVYKFASALRYLSYLSPDDTEQREMLDRIADPFGLDAYVAAVVERARQSGNFMPILYSNDATLEPGEPMRRNEGVRGISTTVPTPLGDRLWLPPGDDPRGFDWYAGESYADNPPRWRWSGPNPRPRLLIPVVYSGSVDFAVYIARLATDELLENLQVLVNQRPIAARVVHSPESESYVLKFSAVLRAGRATVVEFRMDGTVRPADFSPPSTDKRLLGFCLLGTEIRRGSSTSGWTHAPELALAERDIALADRDDAVAARDAALASLRAISASRIWRYSAGYRSLRTILRRG